ncbi:hypothetical protein [Terrisporobacter mayombei]|uniref:Uncharacterized protein n=1 Tax=Terrisporobacter mayombei TaxID=1541 RepID=A0ABY9PX88_9FIRM|nr:hypothetical protein [Terrisporobacter mayombei]MCC3868164.1 hypothetical protein [Terrisporobacter mayombei]WMT80303.1 hypothetical protein TEMA_06170 [Terrisporobacter mayombei]
MNNKIDNKITSNKYTWNESMILDKIQEILDDKNIDDLELSQEELESIISKLDNSLSTEELNDSACIVAENIDGLNVLPEEDIKEYILRLIDYLNNTNLKCIIGEFKGIEFEVFRDSNVDDVFKDYYSKYDEAYGISSMLSDLGLK